MLRYPTGKNIYATRTRIRSQPVDQGQMWCARLERTYSVVLKQLCVVALEPVAVAVAVAIGAEEEVAGATCTAQASDYRVGSIMLKSVAGWGRHEWCARCVRGARLASRDHTTGLCGHIAHLRAVDPSILASDWLIRGQQRLKADLSSKKRYILVYVYLNSRSNSATTSYDESLIFYFHCGPVLHNSLGFRI